MTEKRGDVRQNLAEGQHLIVRLAIVDCEDGDLGAAEAMSLLAMDGCSARLHSSAVGGVGRAVSMMADVQSFVGCGGPLENGVDEESMARFPRCDLLTFFIPVSPSVLAVLLWEFAWESGIEFLVARPENARFH